MTIINILRRITSILLLLFMVIQISAVLMLAADFDEFEIDEIHEVSGYIFLGLILIHTALYWKSLKSLFLFKRKD
jgi:cytochrome b561